MTDERIESEYDAYNKSMGYEAFSGVIKTAERLAKIEVLEEMKIRLRPIIETDTKPDYWAGYQHAGNTFESMIENKITEIKAGG
jgi:hypothetical protein